MFVVVCVFEWDEFAAGPLLHFYTKSGKQLLLHSLKLLQHLKLKLRFVWCSTFSRFSSHLNGLKQFVCSGPHSYKLDMTWCALQVAYHNPLHANIDNITHLSQPVPGQWSAAAFSWQADSWQQCSGALAVNVKVISLYELSGVSHD